MFKWRKFKKMLKNEGVTGKITPETVMTMIDSGWTVTKAFEDHVGGKEKMATIIGKYLKADK